jgi:dTDP-4-dehydrorhamnose reductase
MKILLFGKDGQFGHALQETLNQSTEIVAVGRDTANFDNPETLRSIIAAECPNIIINAAAYTHVDNAEIEPERAITINADAPRVIAEEANKIGAWLIHYSTDYVYDGTKDSPYREDDTTAPLSTYGKTKLAGDLAIQNSHNKYIILRTSWCYSSFGKNFPKTILNLAETKDELRIVSDQIGAPTHAMLGARVTQSIIDFISSHPMAPEQYAGIYHLSATGTVSWFDYAKTLIRFANDAGLPLTLTEDHIVPVAAKDYGAKAARPANSRLDTSKLRTTFGIDLPHWQDDVLSFVQDYCENRIKEESHKHES